MMGHAFQAGLMVGRGRGAPVTLDPTDRGANAVLSGGDLTVTWTQVGGWHNVRTRSAKARGRFYIEAAILGSAADIGLWRVGDYLKDSNSVIGATGGAGVNLGGAACQIALDLEAWRLWRRSSGGGSWNDNPSADPVTGVGGVDISAIAGDVYFVACGSNSSCGPATFNFGEGGFAATPPYGYGVWSA